MKPIQPTPGPWSAHAIYEGDENTGAWFVYGGNRARFMCLDGDGNRDAVTDDDAFTVAFAPAMLSALREIAAFGSPPYGYEGDGAPACAEIAQTVIRDLERALEKRRQDEL